MKLLFDKYDISIPFPQVVTQPTRRVPARRPRPKSAAADRFNEEQKSCVAKDLGNEDEDEDGKR